MSVVMFGSGYGFNYNTERLHPLPPPLSVCAVKSLLPTERST